MIFEINPISPIAFSVFGFAVRWYAIAYICAFVVGYLLIKYMAKNRNDNLSLDRRAMDDLFTWIILGVIIGGRLGYVLVYDPGYFIMHPLEIFALWHGGMSFHGGLLGVIIAIFCFAKKWVRALKILDLVAIVAPIGLFFGRIANFINMELMGRATNSDYGVVFTKNVPENWDKCIPGNPCHPSPLYEAATEGLILLLIMISLYKWTHLRRYPGALAGIMAMLYAVFRIGCEFFRTPDSQMMEFVKTYGITMGQFLSGILFIAGGALCVFALRHRH